VRWDRLGRITDLATLPGDGDSGASGRGALG
jgi:hypothetical protein